MSWRTVVITNRCKLDTRMGYLMIRGEDVQRVFLDEIAILIIENPAVSLTGCLIEALTEKKVKVIFCGSDRSPVCETVPYHGSHDSSDKIRTQIQWDKEFSGKVWQAIIREKIRHQADLLEKTGKTAECELVSTYIDQVEPGDTTNREGHAAKVYFNALFGMNFRRGSDDPVNSALNFGYSLILSAFNREVSANGYLTQLGLFHDNMFNHFNLSSDLMEPFRPLIDSTVYNTELKEFGKDEKRLILSVLNEEVYISGTSQTLLNAIKIYTRSIFRALEEKDIDKICFIE